MKTSLIRTVIAQLASVGLASAETRTDAAIIELIPPRTGNGTSLPPEIPSPNHP